MPRLFTALEIPAGIGAQLSIYRGGLAGARWVDPADYHVTLRFFGDLDGATAREVAALLDEARPTGPLPVEIVALDAFGGARPRALIARIAPGPALARLQAEHESVARRAGIEPEGRKFTPHVTLARFRNVRPGDVAALLARAGAFPRLAFVAERAVLLSSRDSVGGGPYVLEAAYPLATGSRDAG